MFYINPPKGKVALHILENSVFTRLEYLKLLDNNKTDNFCGNFEYLLENSTWDNIGHFTLRLIASTSKELWQFWVKNEELLFKQRLDHLSIRQIHRLFRNIVRNLNKRECDQNIVSQSLLQMSLFFLKPLVFNHIMRNNHAENCQKFRCQVPFTAIPDLVEAEKKHISHAGVLVATDPRLASISKVVRKCTSEKLPMSGQITAKNINEESRNFPPCMQNLHSVLRNKHRLSHHARFQYSLFLKECGMQMEDAIHYWREEYLKPHTCEAGCTHSWQKDERKYLYSIRHLYGLEGGRKNYKTPNCEKICEEVPSLRYEGGCPFKHFDSNQLVKLLQKSLDKSVIEERFINVTARKPEAACSEFLRIIHQLDDQSFAIHSPVQFYTKVTSEII
ncbi:DNA primase large subunit-like isoform X2 [Venturia canescens]|uniref:DNA primase large subunit-like isoform X2 n=1 Tax=Venturia canescens TaxID=32260 RepID=UPI001C9C95E8|nr:DNA primase large subunit-like isoform X2 [Venturia canescens]